MYIFGACKRDVELNRIMMLTFEGYQQQHAPGELCLQPAAGSMDADRGSHF